MEQLAEPELTDWADGTDGLVLSERKAELYASPLVCKKEEQAMAKTSKRGQETALGEEEQARGDSGIAGLGTHIWIAISRSRDLEL